MITASSENSLLYDLPKNLPLAPYQDIDPTHAETVLSIMNQRLMAEASGI